jgi:hypothetical protein
MVHGLRPWKRTACAQTEGAMSMGQMLTAAGIGAGLMYLFDPQQGDRRRALLRDRMMHVASKTGDAADATSRDMRNRARGVVASFRSRLGDGHAAEPDDAVLLQRVRARLGRIVDYPGAVETSVRDGRVTLRGPVLANDVGRLLRRVRSVRGVKDVQCELDVHHEPGAVPELQGARRAPSGGEVFELVQQNWSPSARVITGGIAGFLLLWGARRSDMLGMLMTLGAGAILTRGATNMSVGQLLGLGEGAAMRHRARAASDSMGRAQRPEGMW